ncbi:MAG: hypothetical protein H7Z37_04840 [Pyrinomonadaceae bacterium]|nr:hypothetical protein [Pyrinomonadaceae bacterium]
MKTLEITIPDEVFGVLNSVAKPQNKFVLEAIQEKLEREKAQNFKQLLEEGYIATAKEDLALTKEFEAADFDKL